MKKLSKVTSCQYYLYFFINRGISSGSLYQHIFPLHLASLAAGSQESEMCQKQQQNWFCQKFLQKQVMTLNNIFHSHFSHTKVKPGVYITIFGKLKQRRNLIDNLTR